MRWQLEGRASVQKLFLALMGASFAGGAALALTIKDGIYITAIFGALAAINFYHYQRNKTITSAAFPSFIKKCQTLRTVEAGSIAAANLLAGSDQLFWLFGIPLILAEALTSRTAIRPAIAGVAIAGTTVLSTMLERRPISQDFSTLAVLAAALFGSIVLVAYRQREESLLARDRRMSSLMDTASAVASRDPYTTILETVKAAVRDLGATAGYVSLVREDDLKTLVTEVAYSTDGPFEFPDTLQLGNGVSGYVAQMGQPLAIYANKDEKLDCDGVDLAVQAAVSVPLITRGVARAGQALEEQSIGALTLLYTDSAALIDQQDIDLLQSLSALLATAVSNQRMEERQRTTFLHTLESLATALEARDDYTRGHSHRVCELSLLIGQQLNFSSDALEELRIGTTLHDIGKIGVPDAILNKPGRLTDEEFVIMKSHPIIGYDICRPLMLSEGVLMIIRNHHEKLDGSGYPDGLKAGEIPLSLRIVCVADAFDAMSSRRAYRGVMDIRHVLAELSKGAGIQFDPVVVEILRELLNSGRLDPLYEEFWTEAEAA
jgi:HD-GYP domain-containing protein (c-di-GMP phosphodiesterase class II)